MCLLHSYPVFVLCCYHRMTLMTRIILYFAAIFKLLVSFVSFDDLNILFVVPMSHMPFVASPAPIHRHTLCFELRVLIKIFPRIILRLISLLSLPGVMLSSVVLRVWLKWWNFIEVFMSFVAHVLFCVVCCLNIPY